MPHKLITAILIGLFTISISSVLSGCGNKGDLYLPDTGSVNKTKAKKKS